MPVLQLLRPLLVAATVAGSLLGAMPSKAADLEGRIELREGRKTSKEVRTGVVWWSPEEPVVPETPEEPYELVTVRKQFQPRVLAIPTGAEVRFPNADPILHNVFSLSPVHRFDLGLYRQGEGKSTRFETPGIVRVYCNVHHSMVAHIVVLDTPWFTSPSMDGTFRLEGLPEGPGTLHVWHELAGEQSLELELPTAREPVIELEASRARVPQHRNKFGKPYPRSRRGRGYS